MPSKKINEILPTKYGWLDKINEEDSRINGMTFDSRKVSNNFLFAAVKGNVLDGHKYIENAIRQGATTIVCEIKPKIIHEKINYLIVKNTPLAMAEMAKKFFDNPSEKLQIIGVTGTNGKTSVATMLYKAWNAMKVKAGLISTVDIRYDVQVIPSALTTPDIINLHRILYKMVKCDVTHVAMEISSHAIDQNRVKGIRFRAGVFTNISHDHLDYHGDMKTYIGVKQLFFKGLSKDAFCMINIDDPRGKLMVENASCIIRKYSLRDLVDYKAKIINMDLMGMLLELNQMSVFSRLTGKFNAYNILAVFGVLSEMNFEKNEVLKVLSNLKTAEGRFDCMVDHIKNMVVIIDYAHTPDALKNVLQTVKEIGVKGQIITVFGCGGNRDRTKRPKMAKIAAHWSDKIILTTDNPRNEDPKEIIIEMSDGLSIEQKRQSVIIEDRAEAIKMAYMLAGQNDVIVVSGKGHEKYQDVKGEKIPFDDKEIIKSLMKDFNDIKE